MNVTTRIIRLAAVCLDWARRGCEQPSPRRPTAVKPAGGIVRCAIAWMGPAGALAIALVPPVHAATFTIAVGADGSFKPSTQTVFDGDTVIWKLADPKSDAIVRLRTATSVAQQPLRTKSPIPACGDYRAFDAADPNEFTGPMPRAASGIFALAPDGPGRQEGTGAFCESSQCLVKVAEVKTKLGTTKCICETAGSAPYATMASTWSDPSITGVFIRLRWSEMHTGPGRFDWSVLEREIEQAVAQGKLYSIGVKAGLFGTPAWIETEGNPRARRYRFVDHGDAKEDEDEGEDEGGGDRCGKEMFLGSPADQAYRTHYFAMLTELAARIRAKNAWYRALAYIKPSGLNLYSHENRLPRTCDPGCLCNPGVWAGEPGYQPSELYEFYREQLALLKREFPGKDIAYALIQDGFPLVGESGEYVGQSPLPQQVEKNNQPCKKLGKGQIPFGNQQTECILEESTRDHPSTFVVQHNGLGPACGDKDGNGKDDCLPQYLVVQAGKEGRMIGFQTGRPKVKDSKQLDDALENGVCNSEATFLETYEEMPWQARTLGGVLDVASERLCDVYLADMKARTLTVWSDKFLARRNLRGRALGLPDFQPGEHQHTFKRTVTSGSQTFRYAHAAKCSSSGTGKIATITIVPPLATDADTLRKTATSGLDDIPPANKNPTSQLATLTQDATIGLRGLTLREAPGRACQLSLWYTNLRGQPPRSITLQNTANVSGVSNCSGGEPDKTVLFETESQYVHGLRVCTGDNLGIRGIEVFGAKVNDDTTVSIAGQPSQRMTLSGCKTWSNTVACGPQKIAVGVTTFFDTVRGYVGIGLQCRSVIAEK
jgi:hypothetical protein